MPHGHSNLTCYSTSRCLNVSTPSRTTVRGWEADSQPAREDTGALTGEALWAVEGTQLAQQPLAAFSSGFLSPLCLRAGKSVALPESSKSHAVRLSMP
jgi:hypothetical protein